MNQFVRLDSNALRYYYAGVLRLERANEGLAPAQRQNFLQFQEVVISHDYHSLRSVSRFAESSGGS